MSLFEVFQEAIALPTTDTQQEYIEQLRYKSPELASTLEQMLTAAAEFGDKTLGVGSVISAMATEFCRGDISGDLIGQQLGCWRLEQLLAQGGMSVVYLASRQDGQFEQQMAIKVLNPLLYPVTEYSNAFDEAGFCARLNHSAITTVFDVGVVTHNGHQAHFIVMEYVQGLPLAQWLDQQQPNATTLLKLLVEVCAALHYAHAHQVIHADIKPANILVDEHGHARLIDFGIAQLKSKKSDADCSGKQYMRALSFGFSSPEQLAGAPLTVLSDVFSMGKLIEAAVKNVAFNNLQQKEIAAIIGKATAIDTNKRYMSMRELQMDLHAVLHKTTISALHNTPAYKVKKFIVRQPWLSALGVALFVSAGVFAALMWQHNVVLERERRAAEQVANFMVDVFTSADPEAYDGNPISAQDLLITAKAKLTDAKSSSVINHRLQLHLASALAGIGEYEQALPLLDMIPAESSLWVKQQLQKIAIKLDQSELEQAKVLLDGLQPETLSDEAKLKYFLYSGRLAYFQDDFMRSLEWLDKAEYVAQKTQGYSDLITIKNYKLTNHQQLGNLKAHIQEAHLAVELAKQYFTPASAENMTALLGLELAYATSEKYQESAAVLEEIYRVKQQRYPKDHPSIALTLNEMGSNYTSMEQYDKAIELHQQAIQMIEGRYGQHHIDYIYGNAYLGNAYGHLKRHAEAIQAHKLSLQASEKLFGAENLITINALANLGLAHHEQGDHQQAKVFLVDALQRALKLFDEKSLRVALIKSPLGSTLLALNELEQAQLHLQQSLDVLKATFGEQHIRYQKALKKLNEVNRQLNP